MMADKGYDSFLVLKEENIHYLTGFSGKGSAGILFIGDRINYLLVHFIYFLEAKKSISMDADVLEYRTDKFKNLPALLEESAGNIGIEDDVSYRDFQKIEDYAQNRGKKVTPESGMVESLRAVKGPEELEKINKACDIADKVVHWIAGEDTDFFLSRTEAELALDIERKILEFGGDGTPFDMVIANRQNSSLPHYRPSNRKIRPGPLLIDFGVLYKNYCCDITRTFFVGLQNYGKLKKIYDIVLEAQDKAIQACREDICSKELDSVARKVIEDEGFGRNYGHGLGHGVGLQIHEAPVIGLSSDEVLKSGMVVTIEPGIYLDELGGVRIEDMVLVKKNSCQVLFSAPKDFMIIKG